MPDRILKKCPPAGGWRRRRRSEAYNAVGVSRRSFVFAAVQPIAGAAVFLLLAGIFTLDFSAKDLIFPRQVFADTVSTTVSLSVCGNGVVEGAEVCDTGTNTGAYATSTAARNCNASCTAYGPYCGDAILQSTQGEGCDDGNNTSSDFCSDVCVIENLPVGTGGGGGGSGSGGGGGGPFPQGSDIPLASTKVAISGKAFPSADVHILKDTAEFKRTNANSIGDFSLEIPDITPGITTFGIWAADRQGIKSAVLSLIFRVSPNAVTTISGAIVPPTIAANQTKAKLGSLVALNGQAVPGGKIRVYVDSEITSPRETDVDQSGNWSYAFDTTGLQNESSHKVRVILEANIQGANVRSEFSLPVNLYVGERDIPPTLKRADFNSDGKVNLVDFSILLFNWNTADTITDLNSDGRVNLTDFSILLFNWTG